VEETEVVLDEPANGEGISGNFTSSWTQDAGCIYEVQCCGCIDLGALSPLEMVSSQNMCFSMNLGRLYVSNLDQVPSPSLNPSWSQVIISTNHGIFIPTIMH
jgi:hypothetical protein